MSRDALLYLPPEVIEIIAQYLALVHPPTLWSLAKSSKTFYICCRPLIKSILYHDILIKVPEDNKLEEIVSLLIQKLQSADSLRSVRQLFIIHSVHMCHVGDVPQWSPPQLSDLRRAKSADTYTTQYAYLQEGFGCTDQPPWTDRFSHGSDHYHPESMWEPLVNLIKQLPALTDLVWHFPEQFPSSILETLHQDRPQCRLHLDSFWLRSHDSQETDPRELAILTSPSLHSVKLGRSSHSAIANKRYESLLWLLELAPNLKEVHLADWTPKDLPSQEPNVRRRPAPLEKLRFADGLPWLIHGGNIRRWNHYIDFAALRDLKIGLPTHYNPTDLSYVTDHPFPSLKFLSLDLSRGSMPVDCYEVVTGFLRSLPPLFELELIGWHTLIPIESIVSRHGPHLRKLKLTRPLLLQCLNEQEIYQISKHCPVLEELAITINRTQGNSREVALYKALGTIKNLKYLDLNYETSLTAEPDGVLPREAVICSTFMLGKEGHDMPTDPLFDEFDNEFCPDSLGFGFRFRNGHMRRMIIDSIIDGKLARAIFQSISSTKPPGYPLLEDLTIKVNDIGHYERSWVMSDTTVYWRVQRNPCYSDREELMVEESPPRTETRSCCKPWSETRKEEHLEPWLEIIFYQLFPAAKQKEKPRNFLKKLAGKRAYEKTGLPVTWWHHVHSFPLASEDQL